MLEWIVLVWHRLHIKLIDREISRTTREIVEAMADYDKATEEALRVHQRQNLRDKRRLSARVSELTHLLKGNIT